MTTASDNGDLLRSLTDRAAAFSIKALNALAAAAPDDADTIHGVLVVVIDVDPVKLALTLDGAVLATQVGDETLAELAAAVVECGFAKVNEAARLRAVELLASRAAVLTLMVPIGQDVASIHGLVSQFSADGTVSGQSELFVLFAGDAAPVVH
jgi:hypothetical protein